MINKPKLAPKIGYVEVEIDGERTYRNTTTAELIGCENQSLDAQVADLQSDVVDITYNQILIQNGVTDAE